MRTFLHLFFLGVKHRTVTCDGCKENPLCGKRWKCADCSDFDLCSICYNDGKHDLNHEFNRIDEEGGEPYVLVSLLFIDMIVNNRISMCHTSSSRFSKMKLNDAACIFINKFIPLTYNGLLK